MNFIFDNQVWYLIYLLNGVKFIRCKWVFKLKTDKGRNVCVFKANLVYKFSSKFMMVFILWQNLSPVIMLKSISDTPYDCHISFGKWMLKLVF